jgi:hypothetical protein
MAHTGSSAPRSGRRWAAAALAVMAVAVGALLGAAPASAASSTDLRVTVTHKGNPEPGQRATYIVVVTNYGPSKANGVDISYATWPPLKSIKYSLSHGHCTHQPRKVNCHLSVALKANTHLTLIVSGITSAKMPVNTRVVNIATVDSTTKRTNTGNDKAVDIYYLGVPKVAAPIVVPSPSINPSGKLAQLTNTASKVAGASSDIALWTFIVLGAAAMWFVIGLSLHHRRRVADADFDRNDPGDDD